MLSACAERGDIEPEPAGKPLPCIDSRPALIEDFTLARKVDYIGDYAGTVAVASVGMPCASAPHPDRCMDAFDLAVMSSHQTHGLITTQGDTARLWSAQNLVTLFGEIDTVSEAIYFASSLGFNVDCGVDVVHAGDTFRIAIFDRSTAACFQVITPGGPILIESNGTLRDAETRSVLQPTCAMAGRPGI